MLKFAPLSPGDPVCVVAPSGPFEEEPFEAGLALLRSRYEVACAPDIRARHRYLAGTDARRLAELAQALTNPVSRAVFCARGGYGAMRLLPELARRIADAPARALVGFSDVTALHALLQRAGRVSLHAPVVTQLARLHEGEADRLFDLLEGRGPAAELTGSQCLVPGVAEGVLVGGNLSVLTRLLGTPYLPALDSAVLLLEDVAERPYRLDRMWTHLELAGVFRQVSGVVLGSFSGCEEKGAAFTSADVLRELAQATGVPCAAGFPIGHGARNQPVALGVRVRLDAGACRLSALEAPTLG